MDIKRILQRDITQPGVAQAAEAIDQSDRQHREQIAESRRQSRRAELLAWVAIAISIAGLVLPLLVALIKTTP